MIGNTGKMVKTLAGLQGRMTQIQKEIEAKVFTGQAAGGLLTLDIDGTGIARTVVLKPELLTESPEMIADVIAAAINDAHRQKEAFSKAKLKTIASGLLPVGLSIPGLG